MRGFVPEDVGDEIGYVEGLATEKNAPPKRGVDLTRFVF